MHGVELVRPVIESVQVLMCLLHTEMAVVVMGLLEEDEASLATWDIDAWGCIKIWGVPDQVLNVDIMCCLCREEVVWPATESICHDIANARKMIEIEVVLGQGQDPASLAR